MSSYKSNQEVYGARINQRKGRRGSRLRAARERVLTGSETLRNRGREGASGRGGGGHSAVEQIKKQCATL